MEISISIIVLVFQICTFTADRFWFLMSKFDINWLSVTEPGEYVYLNHSSPPRTTADSGCLQASSGTQKPRCLQESRERQQNHSLTVRPWATCRMLFQMLTRHILPVICSSDNSLSSVHVHMNTHTNTQQKYGGKRTLFPHPRVVNKTISINCNTPNKIQIQSSKIWEIAMWHDMATSPIILNPWRCCNHFILWWPSGSLPPSPISLLDKQSRVSWVPGVKGQAHTSMQKRSSCLKFPVWRV